VTWPLLTAAIENFQSVRARTIEMTEGLSDDQAARSVRVGTWSVSQVLDHLVKTEVAFRKYLIQALERARAGEIGTIRLGFREVDPRLRPLPAHWMPLLTPLLFGLHAVIPFALRLLVMRKRGLLWVVAPKIAQPAAGSRALAELRAQLALTMQQTLALFASDARQWDVPDTLPRVRVAHPLYGYNDIAQVMQLMAAHEQRHQQQLRAIIRKL
jgi:hypothetical protein